MSYSGYTNSFAFNTARQNAGSPCSRISFAAAEISGTFRLALKRERKCAIDLSIHIAPASLFKRSAKNSACCMMNAAVQKIQRLQRRRAGLRLGAICPASGQSNTPKTPSGRWRMIVP